MVEKYLAGKHLLIAEDNLTNQIVVTRMIELLGGTFDLAVDGVEAIELYNRHKYDLALLDIEMPRKSGLEVIRHIRNDPKASPSFPVIALTAFVLGEHKVKIREAGATSIVSKPIVDVAEFGRMIASFLEYPVSSESADGYIEINKNALDELQNSLGNEVVFNIIENLDSDLNQIQAGLEKLASPVNKDQVRVLTHSLLSLAGMAGATGLVEETQNLNDAYLDLNDEELLEAASDIMRQIKKLRNYLTNWRGN